MFLRPENNRYSMTSNSDTFHSPRKAFDSTTYDSSYASNGAQRPRYDSNQLLMLPAPLAVNRNGLATTSTQASMSTTVLSRSSEDGSSEVGSQQRLVPSPGHDSYTDEYDSPPISGRYQSPQSGSPFQERVSRTATQNAGVLRQATGSQYPGETQVSYGYQAQMGYESPVAYTAEPDELPNIPATAPPAASPYSSRARGVSLADNGPVPGPEGVRRVSRQPNKRPSSQAPPQNRYSRSSSSPFSNLPPGAAPPQPGYGY